MIRPLQILLVCISAAVIGFVVTPLVRALAVRMGLTDRPDSHRKLHNRPIPLGGGVCILLAMWGGIALLCLFSSGVRDSLLDRSGEIWKLLGFLLAGMAIVALGLLDDRFVIRGRHKLLGQILVSLMLYWFGYDIQSIRLFGWQIDLGLLSVPVTLGWLVLATNSLNLIDGIDGLASTVGILLSVTLASLALLNGHRNEALILASLAGATVGFLPYNFPPARMFLGDAGSMLIGMSLGAVSITGALKGPTVAGLAAPLAIWTIPLFDTFAAIVRRKLTGRSLYMSDRSHLHHCLFQIAGSARRTIYLVVLACVGTCIGALASVALKSDLFAMISAFSVVGVLIVTRTFGYGEMQLLATNLRSFTQWILPLRPTLPSQRRTVHLQGSRHWEELWDSLMEFTDEFNLTRMRLDVTIPSVHEDYHAAWVSPSYDDRWPQWQTEIPLRRGEQPLGQLVVAGLHDGFSACGQIAKFMDALRDFERRFEETIAKDDSVVAQPLSDAAKPTAAGVTEGQLPILSGPGGSTDLSESNTMRLILALAIIAGSEMAIRVIDSSMDPAPIKATLRPLSELPTTIGPWIGHDLPLDRHIFRNSGAADMVNRKYRNSVDDQVAVNVGTWLDYAPVMPHKPEICYPSAGWEIDNRKLVKVSPLGGQPFKARLLTLQNKDQRIALLYWALMDSTVAVDDGEVRQVLQKHRGFGKTRPPVMKVMLQCDAPDPAAAEQHLLEMAGQLAPQLDAFLRQ